MTMPMPQVEPLLATVANVETEERKQPIVRNQPDESLSEWERARMTSKTWSMEQD